MVSGIVCLFFLPLQATGVRIPLFITPLKTLPQPQDKTSSFYKPGDKNIFFSRVTAWDVWQATNFSVKEIYNRTVYTIINDANFLYQTSVLSTDHLNVHSCRADCYELNISKIEYYTDYNRNELNGKTIPPITLGQLHEAVVETLEDHFCFTMQTIEQELEMSSFNVTSIEWKQFLPRIAWYAIQCKADILTVTRSELTELLREDEATILKYSLSQLDSNLNLPFEKIHNAKRVFEYDALSKYIMDDEDDYGSSEDSTWVYLPLYQYIEFVTNFATRDLQIFYNWNDTHLYALQFIPLKSYASCSGVLSLQNTMYNISKSILEDFTCPTALVLSNSVQDVQKQTRDLGNALGHSLLSIFTQATGIESWIEIANILKLNYTDGLIIDTPHLQHIARDEDLIPAQRILTLSVPQIIAEHLSLNKSMYIYENYKPIFNEILSTYEFTRKELALASGQNFVNEITITEVHEWILKTIYSRYDVDNIAALIGLSAYFSNDLDLASLPSTEWPDIIEAVIQQSFKQVINAFTYDLQTHPHSVSILLQPDRFQTVLTTQLTSFDDQHIGLLASCLFNKGIDSFESSNFREYHEFYNNTMAETMMKKILFETKTLEEFLSQWNMNLQDIEDTLLLDSIEMATGLLLLEIECLYGDSIESVLKSGLKWKDVWNTRLCDPFTNLTLLEITRAVGAAPAVNCGKF